MSLNGQTGNLDTLGLITGAGLVSTANVSISAGKTLTVGSSVVVDTDGLIPYSVVKGTPSALTWATLSGKP